MSSPLEERVALVTGGASGIGLATARELAGAGARVLVTDVQPPPAELTADFVKANVRSSDDWAQVVEAAEQRLGGLDLAFLNAGVAGHEPDITAVTDAEYERLFDINVRGVILGTRAAVPAMERRGGGAIVATASLAGLLGFAPDPLYTATKHAVVGFVRALAPQLQDKGITINAVCPGLTDTPIVPEAARAEIERTGFPMIEPAAVARAVVERLLGDETGGAWVCQAGRDAVRYAFRGVPGPAGHERPPAGVGDPSATA